MAITFIQLLFLDRLSAKKERIKKEAMLFYLFLSPLQVAPFSFLHIAPYPLLTATVSVECFPRSLSEILRNKRLGYGANGTGTHKHTHAQRKVAVQHNVGAIHHLIKDEKSGMTKVRRRGRKEVRRGGGGGGEEVGVKGGEEGEN